MQLMIGYTHESDGWRAELVEIGDLRQTTGVTTTLWRATEIATGDGYIGGVDVSIELLSDLQAAQTIAHAAISYAQEEQRRDRAFCTSEKHVFVDDRCACGLYLREKNLIIRSQASKRQYYGFTEEE